jgi:hypothetical protein
MSMLFALTRCTVGVFLVPDDGGVSVHDDDDLMMDRRIVVLMNEIMVCSFCLFASLIGLGLLYIEIEFKYVPSLLLTKEVVGWLVSLLIFYVSPYGGRNVDKSRLV